MSLHALANDMASKGRYGDSMLVHMSPNEVAGLHALALHHGEKLTINPDTGLPEAFKLKSFLPMILGAALAPLTAGTSLAFLGASPLAAGLTVGAGYGLAKGSLKEGLIAGLGAYGGAGLAASLSAAGVSEAAAQAGFSPVNGMEAAALENPAVAGFDPTNITANTTASTTPATTAAEAASAQQQALISAGATPAEIATATPMPVAEQFATAGFTPPTGLEALKQGAQSIYDKGTFGDFAKANKSNLYAVGASAALAPEDEEGMPETKRDPGYIRPARYDWRTGKYEYFEPVKANEWGTRNLSEYTNASDPNARTPIGRKDGGLMALANGGAIAFDDGGFVIGGGGHTPEQMQRFIDVKAKQDADAAAKLAAYTPTGYLAPTLARMQGDGADEKEYNRLKQMDMDRTEMVARRDAMRAQMGPDDARVAVTNDGGGYSGNAAFTTGEGSGPDRTGPREPLNSMGLPVTPRPGEPGSPEARAAAYEKQMAELEARKAARAAAGEPNYNRFAVTGFGAEGRPNGTTYYDTTDPTYTGAGTGSGAAVSQRSAASPYITPEAVDTRGVVGARNMNAGWNSYYDTAKPGDVWSFAGGTLTRNADGSATFVGPDGRRSTFDRNTPYSEVAKNAPSIAAKWAEDYGYTPSSGGGTTPPPVYTPTPGPSNPQQPVPNTPPIATSTSGGSRTIYEYLLENGEYPVNPYLPIDPATGKRVVAKSIYDTPGYEALKPKPSASLYSTNPDVKPTGSPGTGNEWVWENDSGIRSTFSKKGKWVAKPVGGDKPAPSTVVPEPAQVANGGLVPKRMALGGLGALAGGGRASQYNLGDYSDGGRLLKGPGDGVSDNIPATIGGKQPARLADGEFVVPARIVSELGNGSTDAGARKLYAMMDRVQKARGKTTGKNRVAANSRADKYLPA
jgi:hypothetical protein